jgi:hypothetical protein
MIKLMCLILWLSFVIQSQMCSFDQLSLILVLKLFYLYCYFKNTLAHLWSILLYVFNPTSHHILEFYVQLVIPLCSLAIV